MWYVLPCGWRMRVRNRPHAAVQLPISIERVGGAVVQKVGEGELRRNTHFWGELP